MAKSSKNSRKNKNTDAASVQGSPETQTQTGATNMATETKATKVKATAGDFKVLSTVEVSPAQCVLTEEFRGRSKPVDDSVIVDRADSIRRNGQLQPVQAIRNADGTHTIIFGNTRALAGLKILNGYTNAEGKEVRPDPNFKLRVEVVEADAETAFLRNVVENAQRTQTSPIDNAINQQKLRDAYGMSDAMITKHYGYSSQASVSRLKKLLTLEPEYQDSVHNGTLTQAAAFLFADVPAGESRQKVWLKAVDKSKGEESVGTTEMVTAIKEWRKEEKEAKEAANGTTGETGGTTGEAPANGTTGETGAAEAPAGPGRPASGKTSLTLKQFKDTVSEIAADPACPAVVEQAMGMMLSFISGETEPAGFAQWFAKNLIGGDIVPEVKAEVSAEDSFNPEANPRAGDAQ